MRLQIIDEALAECYGLDLPFAEVERILLHLPSDGDVLESLDFAPALSGSASETPARGDRRGGFETPIGNLSVRRVLAAVGAGLASFVALRRVGVGGRGMGRALALHLGSGVLVLGIALIVLAA